MTDRKAKHRLLNAAGYYHLKPGWVHMDDFPGLQARINEAVQRAAEAVAAAQRKGDE